ncbi:hypothetical protein [Halodesulfovibrio sp. MK-HDV]|jgi:hypothetical protein|uniref:hypothetical protein n=1 Tax=Halodesulfovibrio sp. MK-HDV TaxID=2599925 RepID=UPI0013721141|nr:hypothetical protein [Halodesulfovibrio sp. MK-HDV]KAF1073317.1 hypothetical protein MKHDV_03702 [Halodesulfovibrio sp. MK-HDV]
MSNLCVLLSLCSMVAFFGALIVPKFFVRWGKRSRLGGVAYLGLAFVLLLVAAAMTEQVAPTAQLSSAENAVSTVQNVPLPNYRIVDEEMLGTAKRQVDVLLDERISEEELRAIAKKIKASAGTFDRTFIGYVIKGEKSSPYWATTHYNPDLKVVVLGGTKKEIQRLKATSLNEEGEIIGSWLATNGYACTMTAYMFNGKAFIKLVYADGSNGKYEYKLTKENGKLRFEKPNDFGEYYLTDSNGDLEFWDKDGKFYTARKSQ